MRLDCSLVSAEREHAYPGGLQQPGASGTGISGLERAAPHVPTSIVRLQKQLREGREYHEKPDETGPVPRASDVGTLR